LRQMGLVQTTIAKLPGGAKIVAAFDADEAGRSLVEAIRAAVRSTAPRTGRSDLILETHLPSQEGEDWNVVLQNSERFCDDLKGRTGPGWTCQTASR
jgi:hypothetical protein